MSFRPYNTTFKTRRPLCMAFALVSVLIGAACTKDMAEQDRLKTQNQPALPDVAGAVESHVLNPGVGAQHKSLSPSKVPPGERPLLIPASLIFLRRGQERFNIHCAPCHDRAGLGQGLIVLRGFQRPRELVKTGNRESDPAALFKIVSDGTGAMAGFRNFITTRDRWAIVAYVRALQLSHQMPSRYLEKGDLLKLESPSAGKQ
jgi:hypothetical protein